MTYWLIIIRRGRVVRIYDSLLPNMIPDRALDMMVVGAVEEMGLCSNCPVARHCHVLQPVANTRKVYRKLCPVLFHDAVRPRSWRVEELA